jgi:hypothetical protein
MGKVNIAKGHVLHRKGDRIENIEIILKGGVFITDRGEITLHADQGTMLGAFRKAGDRYRYDYVASGDSMLFVYDYRCEDDLIATVTSNKAIAPVMASANMALLNRFLDVLFSLYENGCGLCSELAAEYEDYRNICAKLMFPPQRYESIESLLPPEKPAMLSSWQSDLCRSCLEQDAFLRKDYYTADINFCIGAIMQAALLLQSMQQQIEQAQAYIQDTKAGTDEFVKEYYMQKAKLDNANRREAMEAGSGDLPSIQNAMNTIFAFAGISSEIAETFRRDINEFMQAPNQREKSAEMRQLRHDIAENFYIIYEAAFYKSQEITDIPAEVRMFFLFGFVDENLAGTANTAALYKYALLWEDDPNGRIMSVYDWLCKIYKGEVLPSKNELDTDWPEYLKEQTRMAVMTQEQADSLLDDRKAMVHFELHSMIATANRITHGSLYSFIPTFYAGEVVRPLENSFVSPKMVSEAIDKIREIDFGCFYRPAFASYPELQINRFDYNVEVLPYILLMPNFGSKGVLWQEIEGRKRTTPAHMVLSVFHAEDLESTIVKMCAQFRWEMCKRIQGVHYSDITDPSLTSEYGNYLQFYKQNHELSGTKKDSLKLVLQQKHNNYKNVFVADYELYIKNEAAGLPRLNKVARDILFRYCTFSKKYRRALAINPQYQPVIERWKVRRGAKQHVLDLFTRKILSMTSSLPPEVALEIEFMKL